VYKRQHQFRWDLDDDTAGDGMFLVIIEENGRRVVRKVIRHE
jgi:hypothetical protein